MHGWLVTFCFFCHVREEEREDLDTSTESKEMERKEQDIDTVTEDEEELGPSKKRRRGNAIMNLFVHLCTCIHAPGKLLCFVVKASILAVIFFKGKKTTLEHDHNDLLNTLSQPGAVLMVSCMFFHNSVPSCLSYLLRGFHFCLKNVMLLPNKPLQVLALTERVVGVSSNRR